MNRTEITGRVYNRLTVIQYVRTVNKASVWKVECECGKTKEVFATNIRSGKTKSCGCFKREKDAESHIAAELRKDIKNGSQSN